MKSKKQLFLSLGIFLSMTHEISAQCSDLETNMAQYLNNYCFTVGVDLNVIGNLCGTCTAWSYYDNATASGIPFATGTNSIQSVPPALIPTPGTYQFSVTDGSNICPVTVVVSGGPPTGGNPTYTNEPLYACEGSEYHLYATVPHSSWKLYNYEAPSGCSWATPPYNGNAHEAMSSVNNNFLTLGPSDATSLGWSLKVRAGNGCGFTSMNSTFIKDRLPRPSISASPNNPLICPGDVVTYCANIFGPAAPYLDPANKWTFTLSSVPAGSATGIVVPPNCFQVTYGATFQSGSITLVANGATYGATTVVPCSDMNSPSQNLSVKIKPNTPIPITCIPGMCGNGTYTISTPAVPGAVQYEWWITSTGGCGISIASQVAPIITSVPSYTFNISNYTQPACDNHVTAHVVAVSSCGIKSNQRQTLLPSVPPVPPMPTGPTANACNSTIQYSIPNVPGASTYIWDIAPTTYQNLIGQGTTTILFDDYPSGGNSSASYSIKVKACNSCGCSVFSPAIVVTTVPDLTGGSFSFSELPVTPTNFCSPPIPLYGNVVFTWSQVGAPMTSYTWNFLGNTAGVVLYGETTNNVDLDFNAFTSTSTVTGVQIRGNNNCGTSAWYSATASEFVSPGWTFTGGCVVPRIGHDSPASSEQEGYFSIYPNPSSSNSLTLEIPEAGAESSGKLIITTLEGKMVYEQNLSSKETLINPSLANGIYIAKILTSEGTYVQKLSIRK